MKLKPFDIHLISLSEGEELFFHPDTLQMYPIDKKQDESLYRFLHLFSEHQLSKSQLEKSPFKDVSTYIRETIMDGPKSRLFRKNIKEPVFNSVILPISAICNLNCPYCFAQTDGGFKFKSFTKKSIQDVVDFIVNHSKDGIPISIAFFGGEPLIKFDLIKFCIEYATTSYPTKCFKFSITTNGTLINDDIIKFFSLNKVSVLVSIDGPDNEFNLRTYKVGGPSVVDVVSNIQKLKNSDVQIHLRATIVNNNPYILDSFKFFENLEVPFNIVFAYKSENKSHRFADYDAKTRNSIENQLNEVYDYYKELILSNKKIYNDRLNELYTTLRYRKRRNISCSAGRIFFTITSDGSIYTCSHFMNDKSKNVGNIYTPEVFNKEALFQLSPVSLSKHHSCQKCWARWICLGGCVAQSIHSGRNNSDSQNEDECMLIKLESTLYVKLCYHLLKLQKNIIKDE